VPDQAAYHRLLSLGDSPRALLDLIASPGFQEHDQWQVQRQALVQEKARVYMKASGVTAEELRRAFLIPCDDVGAQVEALLAEYGPGARVAVLPEGPQTIPYLAAGT